MNTEEDEEFERIEKESGWRKRQIEKDGSMKYARQAFENYMATKGRDISHLWNGARYENVNINTKWSYFLLGWTMNQGK